MSDSQEQDKISQSLEDKKEKGGGMGSKKENLEATGP